jgi:hypothetical protein
VQDLRDEEVRWAKLHKELMRMGYRDLAGEMRQVEKYWEQNMLKEKMKM